MSAPAPHLRDALRRAAHGVGLHHWARERHRDRLLIVCYHGVRADRDPARHWLLLSQDHFARQVRYLAERYACVPLDEGVAALRAGPLRRPTACVTFDDGYRSNRDLALPVLRAHGVPATIFLATDLVADGGMLWTTWLELALQQSPGTAVDLTAHGLGVLPGGAPVQRGAAARAIAERLKAADDAARRATLATLRAALPAPIAPDAAAPFALLGWAEVEALERTEPLLSFGAHTRTHPIVSRLPDDRLAEEVGGSMREVQSRLRRPSRVFAYPNGRAQDFDARGAAAVRAAGGIAAVTTIEGLNGAGADPFTLRRITLGAEDGMASFCLRASGAAELLRRPARAGAAAGAGAG